MDSSRFFKMGIIFILLTLISCTSIGLVQGCSSNPGRLRVIKPYRSDYEYNQHTDAFYKLHTHPLYYPPAERRCAEEGGWLAPPAFASSPQEMAQYVRMMKRFPDIGDYIYVDNDINRMNEEEMIERFGTTRSYPDLPGPPQPLCDVFTRRGEGEILPCGRQKLPFICKVEAKDAHFDKECNVFSVGYRKGENLNSCYGIPSTPYSWDQAYAECAAQGAHLVVLNSKAEHDFVQYFMETNPGVYVAWDSTLFFAGYRATEVADGSPKVFKTIFNETLEEAGFSQWARDRPNNTKDEVCVALNINTGNLVDVNCEQLLGFICEKEIPTH